FVNAIWGSGGDGVLIDSAPGNTLQSNYVRQNQRDGIQIRSSSGNTIGGTSNALTVNFVWLNGNAGVNINGSVSTNNLVQANNIGVFLSATGPQDNHNSGHGVLITDNASNNSVGSPITGLGNFIAFNSLNGVTVISGVGNLIASNLIFNNALLGIDLGNDGIDTNDALDADTGPNNRQNSPIITSVTVPSVAAPGEVVAQAVTTISGTMMSEPNTRYTLEFSYCSQPCASSGHQFSGCIPSKLLLADGSEPMVTTINDGTASYSFQFTLPNNATTGFVNATARKNSNNDTSEISPCQQVGTTSCTYTLNPTSASVGPSSNTGSFSVTTQTGCTWSAVSSDTWLTVTSNANGTGNGTVNYSYAQNPNSTQRSATITLGGQAFTVTQAGASGITISDAQKDGKHFVVTGSGFVAGESTLFVNGEEKRTRVDSPTSIFSKKGAKALSLPARLQVRNSNGAVSNEFIFQLP
ncbi:MAG TPA: BACON domain-containing carbohydrate-binding protein, partial [Pyrinomonadaceae bacterium]|nr:BACON domain-containing carbohydrate-binding protein [Pyrinomonadaceae bacterium]